MNGAPYQRLWNITAVGNIIVGPLILDLHALFASHLRKFNNGAEI